MRCNYCFVLEEKELSDTERFMIKFNELKAENETLKAQLDSTRNESKEENNQLRAELDAAKTTISALTERMQQLETSLRPQRIDLPLTHPRKNYGSCWGTAKAMKIGKVVYLEGLVKGGNNASVIATLPEGWRPSASFIFSGAQNNNQSVRININANGNVQLNGNYNTGWISLQGITFHAN